MNVGAWIQVYIIRFLLENLPKNSPIIRTDILGYTICRLYVDCI